MSRNEILQTLEVLELMKQRLTLVGDIEIEQVRLLIHALQTFCEDHIERDPCLEHVFLKIRSTTAEFQLIPSHVEKLLARFDALVAAIVACIYSAIPEHAARSESSLNAARIILSQLREAYGFAPS